MEFSNRTLAWLVLATIVVSMAGTFISLKEMKSISGAATSNATGTAAVTISSRTELMFRYSALNFGSGSINATTAPYNCTLTINGSTTITNSAACLNFNTANSAGFLTLENTGNTHLNVTLNFSKNAAVFMNTSNQTDNNANASLRFTVSQNESSSCKTLNTTLTAWTEVDPAVMYPVCQGLDYNNANDTIHVGISVIIPGRTPDGAKSLVIMAQGTG